METRQPYFSRETISRFIKGFLVGLAIILPGISGGTLIMALGIYEALIKDLSKLMLRPWLPFGLGIFGGLALSGSIFAWLLTNYTSLFLGLLLGGILASIRTIIGPECRFNARSELAAVAGLIIGAAMVGISDLSVVGREAPGAVQLLIGGALGSAAMILPGLPGSAVLIIMGIYDDMMIALARFDLRTLAVFGVGSVAGIVLLSSALDKLFTRYRTTISWFFGGLIIGTSSMLVPRPLDNPFLFVTVAFLGFYVIWRWQPK